MVGNKKSLAEQFLGSTQAFKDYGKAKKLLAEYEKAKARLKDDKAKKLLMELADISNNAFTGMERMYNIYKAAYDEVAKISHEDAPQELSHYTPNERKAYFEEIDRIYKEATQLREQVQKIANPPKAEQVKESGSGTSAQ